MSEKPIDIPVPGPKKRRRKIYYGRVALALLLLTGILYGCVKLILSLLTQDTSPIESAPAGTVSAIRNPKPEEDAFFLQGENAGTLTADCLTGILVDDETGEILAEKDSDQRIYPASLTKVMTLLVAVEHLEDIDASFTMTSAIIDPLYLDDATITGISPGETVTVRDLFYGMILPSGGDAAVALATLAAGSEEVFVALMNEKASILGMENTHFENVSGMHHENQYSTVADLAVLLHYTLENEFAKTVLSAATYTTTKTEKHPEGIELQSTLFSRMYGDEVEGVAILGGKTGYTKAAGQCLMTFAQKDGKQYLSVFCHGTDQWDPVYDTLRCYEEQLP